MGDRARQDALARYSPAAGSAALVAILDEAAAMGAGRPARSRGVDGRGNLFGEHGLAHRFLDGLKGLEIGASAHNPFGLQTRNVAPHDDYDFYAESSRVMEVEPAAVDLFALADEIPVPDRNEDFVLSSHVVEHLPDPIKAFLEWDRIVRDGGYVFMIVPLKGALPDDAPRALTSLDHIVEDYRLRSTVDTHPLDGVPGGRMGHYHTFTPDSLHAVVAWMRREGHCRWDLVARENVDTKVGNGFTLVYKVHHDEEDTAAQA
jgi:SAM-dependent methyltransferase